MYCKFELEMKVVVNSSNKYLIFNVRLVHSIDQLRVKKNYISALYS